jgi:hypothetical protein
VITQSDGEQFPAAPRAPGHGEYLLAAVVPESIHRTSLTTAAPGRTPQSRRLWTTPLDRADPSVALSTGQSNFPRESGWSVLKAGGGWLVGAQSGR